MDLSLIVLGLTALGGVTMAVMRLRGHPRPPDWFPPLHGLLGAVGVALLGYTLLTRGLPGQAQLALALFVLAALGGFTLNRRYHQRRLALPLPLVLGHGLLALVALALLYTALDDGLRG